MSICILWDKHINRDGYGQVRHKGMMRGAHRVAYCEYHGIDIEAIDGLVVRHQCDNPSCVNPEHLELGTQKDNVQDMVDRGRCVVGSKNHMAKLTDQIVRCIREEYVPYSRKSGTRALAKKHGVSRSRISLIVRGIGWSHIEPHEQFKEWNLEPIPVEEELI